MRDTIRHSPDFGRLAGSRWTFLSSPHNRITRPGHQANALGHAHPRMPYATDPFLSPPLSFNFQPQVRGAAYLLCQGRRDGINESTRRHILRPRRDDDVDKPTST